MMVWPGAQDRVLKYLLKYGEMFRVTPRAQIEHVFAISYFRIFELPGPDFLRIYLSKFYLSRPLEFLGPRIPSVECFLDRCHVCSHT